MIELPRTLVVMGLPAESQGLLERAGVPVTYCGVGKVNATYALTRELARYRCARQPLPRVISFGCAGSRHQIARLLDLCAGIHRFARRGLRHRRFLRNRGFGGGLRSAGHGGLCSRQSLRARGNAVHLRQISDGRRRNVHKAADEFLRLFLSLERQSGVAD